MPPLQKLKKLSKPLRLAIYCGASAAALALGSWGILETAAMRARIRADDFLSKGFGVLAGSEARSYRTFLSRNEAGCKTLVTSLVLARYMDDLEWSIQSCTYHKIEIPELYFGLAFHRESANLDAEALRILSIGMAKFPQNPEFHVRSAKLLLKAKTPNLQKVAEHLHKAGSLAPNDAQQNLNIMEYFASIKDWPQARKYAEKLRGIQNLAPSAGLLLGRVLSNSGDPVGAKLALDDAKTRLPALPEGERKRLETQYSDLLAPTSPSPASEPAGSEKAKK